MSYNFEGFIQEGWRCPVCGAVYSPMIMACMNCTGWKATNKTSTTTGDAPIDWLYHTTITSTDTKKADNDTFNKYLNHDFIKHVEEDKPKYNPDYENWDNEFRNG